jgi:uncharacterized membrane protein YoaK (UPF0700 family)
MGRDVATERETRGGTAGRLLRSLGADPVYGPMRGLLLVLTVLTGVVDAVSILSLGRVFVANMTGNVVFAAFAVVGAPGFSLSASLFALAGFLAGAYLGGVLISRSADRGTLLRGGTAAELGLVAAALLIAALSGGPGAGHGTLRMTGAGVAFAPAVTDAVAALLACALGIQNAAARRLAVPDLTTTVLTMTITGLGADLRAVVRGAEDGGSGRTTARAGLGRRLLAVAAMVAGAAAGATLVLRVSPLSALALAVALLLAVSGWAAAAARRPAAWRAWPRPKGAAGS